MTTTDKKTMTGNNHAAFRARLLDAAGQVFADRGFEHATVREIVERAGASLGAVNYHFGDKRGLYREALAYAHRHTIEQFREAAGDPDCEQRLVRYIRKLLSHVLEQGSDAWPGRVLCNELSELISQNVSGKRQLLRRYIRPRFDLLLDIVRQLLGQETEEEIVVRHAISVVGQCTYYLRSRPVAEAAYARPLSAADVEPLTAHVARVSLAGIEAERTNAPLPSIAQTPNGKPTRTPRNQSHNKPKKGTR